MEHGIGSAYLGLRLAELLRLQPEEREAIYYGALLKDAGCTSCLPLVAELFHDELVPRGSDMRVVDGTNAREVLDWLAKYVPSDAFLPVRAARVLALAAHCVPVLKEAAIAHCEIGELFTRRLGFGDHVRQAVRHQLERWDGKGPAFAKKREESPVAGRILALVQMAELWHGFGGRTLAETRVREGRGRRFDPDLAGAFLSLAQQDDLWPELEHESLHDLVLDMRPDTSAELRTEDQIDGVCEALADFADVKARSRASHSVGVAALAAAIGRRLGLSEKEQTRVRRAALVHDLGVVTVPVQVLAKQEPLTEGEAEQLRLHSYYTERVLERVAPLRDLALAASSDHEWFDGRGYHHRLAGEQIPLIGRILAVADTCVSLAGRDNPPQAAAKASLALAGTQLDPICCDAIAGSGPRSNPSPTHSDQLTDREIEVLQLLARGLSNPQIAQALVISKKTVEHHLEHVYNKVGISSRTAAVAYAIHQRLTP
jgi:HD-GYP domain-containing protein (c-di-GMP phosphodiesterase class II)